MDWNPQYYCGDNLDVSIRPYNSETSDHTTITAAYVNVSEVTTDMPIYGHASRLPDAFSAGNRLVQGTIALIMGTTPEWMLAYPDRPYASFRVQPNKQMLPDNDGRSDILRIEYLSIQGVHNEITNDGSFLVQVFTFIGILAPFRSGDGKYVPDFDLEDNFLTEEEIAEANDVPASDNTFVYEFEIPDGTTMDETVVTTRFSTVFNDPEKFYNMVHKYRINWEDIQTSGGGFDLIELKRSITAGIRKQWKSGISDELFYITVSTPPGDSGHQLVHIVVPKKLVGKSYDYVIQVTTTQLAYVIGALNG